MAFIGNALGGGPNNDQKQANNLLNYNAQAATPISQSAVSSGKEALGTGMNFLNQFNNQAGKSGNWFQSLLSGNQANTTAALSPDINRIRDQNQETLTSTAALAPRGGGRGSMLFNLPFKSSSQISGLYNTARPAAATNLANLAGEYGSVGIGESGVGTNLFNTGVGAINAGTQAAGILGNQAFAQHEASQQLGMSIAQMLASGLQGVDFSKLFKAAPNLADGGGMVP